MLLMAFMVEVSPFLYSLGAPRETVSCLICLGIIYADAILSDLKNINSFIFSFIGYSSSTMLKTKVEPRLNLVKQQISPPNWWIILWQTTRSRPIPLVLLIVVESCCPKSLKRRARSFFLMPIPVSETFMTSLSLPMSGS